MWVRGTVTAAAARNRVDPRVSVVLTTYNRCTVLRRTVACLLQQTFDDFELIICDDASPDETAAVALDLAAQDARIRYYRNPVNVGMPGNLNVGVRLARGQYVANLHDGDIYGAHLLEHWVDALDQCPNAAFVFARHRERTRDGREVVSPSLPLGSCNRGGQLLRVFHSRPDFTSPVWGTVMARREAYISVGSFRRRYGFRSDVDMWLRFAEQYDVAYVQHIDITLPSKEELPSDFKWNVYQRSVVGRLMLLESRLRMANGDPIEIGRQLSGFGVLLGRNALAVAKDRWGRTVGAAT